MRATALVLGALVPSCVFEDRSCEGNCTKILISVAVEVVDTNNQPVPHMATKTVYVPTGGVIHESTFQNDGGSYVIVDDLVDKSQLLPGDRHDLRFYAHSPAGTASADFVVLAGECVCHVTKVSGPDQLILQPH